MPNTTDVPTPSVIPACPQCGDPARLYGVEPHIRLAHTEIYTYVCDACDVTEVVVVPLANRANEARPAAATH
jgi:hypothetical protein